MTELSLAPDLVLRSLTTADATDVLAILDVDRGAFDPWLRWSGNVHTLEQAVAFLAQSTEREATGNGFHLGIRIDDRLVGGVVCWSIDPATGTSELGYWLDPSVRGQRLAERATRAVMEHLHAGGVVRQVVFRCLVENVPSRALAQRLGATLQRIERPNVLINGEIRDHAVYATPNPDPGSIGPERHHG